jgi:hypothetical protein
MFLFIFTVQTWKKNMATERMIIVWLTARRANIDELPKLRFAYEPDQNRQRLPMRGVSPNIQNYKIKKDSSRRVSLRVLAI